MKIHSLLLLLGLHAVSLYAQDTSTSTKTNAVTPISDVKKEANETKANVVKPVSDVEKEVNENDKAIQGLGDLLIKKGLLSPWLEQMRDTQKALNDLDTKNKLGMREKALKTEEDRIVQCKEWQSKKDTPSNDPLEREVGALQAQQEPLIQQIIAKKKADISELIALNDKIDAAVQKYIQKISSDAKGEQQSFDSKSSSSEYNALVKKLQALMSILWTAAYGEGQQLDQPIKDLLASNEAKEYVAILSKPMDYEHEHCPVSLGMFRFSANDQYGNFITGISEISLRKKRVKNSPKPTSGQ